MNPSQSISNCSFSKKTDYDIEFNRGSEVEDSSDDESYGFEDPPESKSWCGRCLKTTAGKVAVGLCCGLLATAVIVPPIAHSLSDRSASGVDNAPASGLKADMSQSPVPASSDLVITTEPVSEVSTTSPPLLICRAFSNNDTVPIPNLVRPYSGGTAKSEIKIDQAGDAGIVEVDVNIKHTASGDLMLGLRLPDGSLRKLQSKQGGMTDNIDRTFLLDLTGLNANGTWSLECSDRIEMDEGVIDQWSISLFQTQQKFTNNNTIPINDLIIPMHGGVASSSIQVDEVGDPGLVKVTVDIDHTARGDLKLRLFALDGTQKVLHNRKGGDQDDIHRTYEVDMSGSKSYGNWTLEITDYHDADSGVLKSWGLEMGCPDSADAADSVYAA
ncbi:proprotein convertase P-domain-containing protein [Endozoicomonas atrinae]|uniref:proprotein convertase P-domain-containing protein n=1 Tax=Endozoicomonas atrinae TaxID=1333660 RepID=UPI000824B8DF|nr:proprotein convertase P-domain-containing protein [Endozoicomonas atrinae]